MRKMDKGANKGVTLIAAHTEVVGDIKFTDQLYISGKVNGNVLADNASATVVVSEEGCVSGEVRVPNVVINGLIEVVIIHAYVHNLDVVFLGVVFHIRECVDDGISRHSTFVIHCSDQDNICGRC